ncbi:MAG: AsnC family transcriptional regulator [Paludibacteraceae bacterium]|nr:AsnC family transcriptional regulator [Paludibacteraceae bacterium]
MDKIDELDRKILNLITRNARLPFRDVAEKCGVSRAAVHQRVQKMFDNGAIVGSGYQVNPKMLGYDLCVLVGIALTNGRKYTEVVTELDKIPEVIEEYYTLGAYSMMIRMFAKNDKDLLRLLTQLQCIEGIAKTETLTCLEQGIGRALPIE